MNFVEESYIKTGLSRHRTLHVIKGPQSFLQYREEDGTPIDRIKLTRPIENVTLSTTEGRALVRKGLQIYPKMDKNALKDMLEDALLNLTEQFFEKQEAAKIEAEVDEQQIEQEKQLKISEGEHPFPTFIILLLILLSELS